MKKLMNYWNRILTKNILIKEYTKNNQSTFKVADKYGCSRSTVYRLLLKYNIPIKSKKELRKGSKSANNKGGKTIYHGYIMIWNPDYFKNPTVNYVREHRLKIEKKLGRRLNSKELVHHIDLDKSNNKLSNLYVSLKQKHHEMHRQLERVAGNLVKLGIIKFNNGNYYIARKYKNEF